MSPRCGGARTNDRGCIDVASCSAYGARHMGDKSPKSKDKNKKQDNKAKSDAKSAAAAKQATSPATPKKK